MKNIFRILMAVLVLGATSCTTEDISSTVVGNGELIEVSFSADVANLGTRATTGLGTKATTLKYRVFDAANKTLLSELCGQTTGSLAEGKMTFTFNLVMVKGMTYDIVLWADAGNGIYTLEDDGKTVTANYNGVTANNENLDAFCKFVEGFDPLEDTPKFTLRRPFAQLNAATNDKELAAKSGVNVTTSSVTVLAHSQFDIAEGTTVGDKTEHTFAVAAIPGGDLNGNAAYEYLSAIYLFVPNENGTLTNATYTFEGTKNGGVYSYTTPEYASIPLKLNYRTNILGSLLTQSTEFTVDIEADWDGADVNVNVWDGTTVTEPAYDTTTNTYAISKGSELAWFASQVNGTASRSGEINTFQGKTFVLTSNIDLAGHEWTPISMSTNLSGAETFRGTFDGQGYTISGLTVNRSDVAGLFGYVYAATIKNVTIEGANLKSNHFAGGVVAWVLNNKGNIQVPFIMENCHVKNSTITSTPELVNGEWDNGDKVGGLIGYAVFEGNADAVIKDCSVEDTTIKAYRDFGGLVGYASHVAIVNCATNNVTLEQDLTHDYKAPNTPTTYGQTIGRNEGGNTVNSNTYVSDGVATDTEDNYHIYNAAGLFWVANEVNKHSNYEHPFEGKTIKLDNDVNLNGVEWTPIGDYRFSANRFCGTFDGLGQTISNLKITKKTDKNDSNKSSYGFFGNMEGTVKNLTIENASVSSYAYTGALIGRLNGGTVENCHVKNSEVSNTYWQGGILIGQINSEGSSIESKVLNCTVSNSSITSKSAVGAISGPATFTKGGSALFENCVVENCQVLQQGSFGGSYDKYFGSLFGYIEVDNESVVNINGCTANNTIVKESYDAPISGDFDGPIYIDGVLYVSTAEQLTEAIKAGRDIALAADIALSEPIQVTDKTFSINGNGHKIGQSSEYPQEGTAVTALLHPIRCTAVIANVVFDGLKVDSPIRSVDTKITISNVTVQNCERNVTGSTAQGLFRLHGESTIDNCTFKNNLCPMCISLNWDGNNNLPQAVTNCVFEENNCISTAVVYYVKGAGCTVNNNVFKSNTVTVTGKNNAATLYMGFTENNVITNNLFKDNTVNVGTSKRVAGGLMIGYAATITDNSFINNTVTGSIEGLGNDVCASVYYTDIDLSGNYWGGDAPVENNDYFVEYPDKHKVIINDYLTTFGE